MSSVPSFDARGSKIPSSSNAETTSFPASSPGGHAHAFSIKEPAASTCQVIPRVSYEKSELVAPRNIPEASQPSPKPPTSGSQPALEFARETSSRPRLPVLLPSCPQDTTITAPTRETTTQATQATPRDTQDPWVPWTTRASTRG
ncbi:hypothetical protein QC763_0012710 [Podospora pseudopauciseta]|uniref:Uncharacterized protein n=1 Tax=Podospora pseudopauciseta TaxID=2093780 RepID=A0ABR0HZ03_9PEZI|nr:hypothetical protein QC763_0012710 [Podospora pseudopauciseta]